MHEALVDAFLITLIAACLAGIGDRPQLLAALLGARHQRPGQVLAGFAIGAAVICVIGAVGGALVHDAVTPKARAMLVAVALAFVGVTGFFSPDPPGRASRFKGGAFLTAAIFGGAFMSGGRAQWLVFALAAATGFPILAAIGGFVAMVAVAAPAALLGKEFLALRLRPWRIAIGVVFLLAAVILFLAAR